MTLNNATAPPLPGLPEADASGGGVLRGPIFRRAAFDRAAEAIGIPGLHPHELRRTAASFATAAVADRLDAAVDAFVVSNSEARGNVRSPPT